MALIKLKAPLGSHRLAGTASLTFISPLPQAQVQPYILSPLPGSTLQEGGPSPSKRMLKAEAAWPWSDVNSMRMLLPSLSRPSKGTLSVRSESYRRADVFVRPL